MTPVSTMVGIGPQSATGLDAYAVREARRVLGRAGLEVQFQPAGAELPGQHVLVLGTPRNNPIVARLLREGFLPPEPREQGYSMRCGPHPADPALRLLAIAGADSRGVLYALRDLEHYELRNLTAGGAVPCFSRRDCPRIQHRGHWVWGCHMPDKPAWLDNMSRWKLNELIHWDNDPPERAREYVEFAHERGISVAWGFGWGWNPDWNFELPPQFDRGTGAGVQMCGSDPFNREFLSREILAKIRTLYAPSGCDGVYFQAFTETAKCACPRCAGRSMGRIMVDFVNPIVDAIRREFPSLWISCGIHVDFGVYDELKELDPRCNIYWENCDAGTSVRGADEDFGYINKTLPYAHGFSSTCPADPAWTEESLQAWMASNAERYAVTGGLPAYYGCMERYQAWARRMLGKPAAKKHGSTVADHSVFCRRTPFMHVALAEALWNPDLPTKETVDGLVGFLKAHGGLSGACPGEDSDGKATKPDETPA